MGTLWLLRVFFVHIFITEFFSDLFSTEYKLRIDHRIMHI